MKFYQYPNCSTCRKAKKFLVESGVEFEAIDITQQPPTEEELLTMLGSYNGELRKLFNTSGVQYRELNLKDKLPTMSVNEAVELLSSNGKLIKRPFLLKADKLGIVGFNEAAWQAFIK
jgi:arsenate reductase